MNRDCGTLKFCHGCQLLLPQHFVVNGLCQECPTPKASKKAPKRRRVPRYRGKRLPEVASYWLWWEAVRTRANGLCECGAPGMFVSHSPDIIERLIELGLHTLDEALNEPTLWTASAGKLSCKAHRVRPPRSSRFPWLPRRAPPGRAKSLVTLSSTTKRSQ